MATVAICPLFDPIFSEIRDYKCRLSDFSTSKEHSVVIAVFLKSECVHKGNDKGPPTVSRNVMCDEG